MSATTAKNPSVAINSRNIGNMLIGKMSETTKLSILSASDNLIEDLSKEVVVQNKEFTENVKFRLSAESNIEAMNREIGKLHNQIQAQQKLIESQRPDPVKLAKIEKLKGENAVQKQKVKKVQDDGAPVRSQLHDEKGKNVVLAKINHDQNERWHKHLDDVEEKKSLEDKNQQALDSIASLKANIAKLEKIRDKYANGNIDGDILRIDELTKNLTLNNALNRHTIRLDEESLATGKILKALLQDCENLLVRNNVINDKLPITLGIQKDDYHQAILNQYMKQESFLVDDEQVEFSKVSVAYFFRIFIVEVKVQNIINDMNKIMEEYQATREKFNQNHEIMGNLKAEDLTPELLQAAHKFNEDVRAKNAFFRAKAKEYTEVLQLQKIGVDRFQERIRAQAAQQVKERNKVADILTKNGINRVGKNNLALKEFFVQVERLLPITWFQHHINEFEAFKKKVLDLNDENNALTGNFSVIKLALEKSKQKYIGVEQLDIQKISRLIKGVNVYLDSTYDDHEKLVDVERRIKELQLEYQAMIENICQDATEILKNKFAQKALQTQDLRQKDEDLMNFLDHKKTDLYNIKGNVDEAAMFDKFMTFETQLAEANQDEEFANENTRQIQSKIDRNQKQFLKMIPIKLVDIPQCDILVDALNKLDMHIKFTDQTIQDAYKKVKDFDVEFRNLEDQIRNKRIKDAEKALGVAFASLEKMNKILEKLRSDVAKVEKDQKDLKNNKFDDQEKQRDTSQFAKEIESKIDTLNEYVVKRDNFKTTLDGLQQDYNNKLKQRESPTGLEFKKIQQESDRVNLNILTQIGVLEGPVTEEITGLKDSSDKLLEKYAYKEKRHGQCNDLRNTKTKEFKTWLEKLKDFEARQDTLEKALKDVGYTPEYAKLYVQLVNRVAKNKEATLDLDNQVETNQKILVVEATDLDYLPLKIVKNLRLDEIYKLLEQMKVAFKGFDDLIKEVEDELKRLEKEVADFLNKLRGSQYNDMFNKMRKLENNLDRLNKKIKEVKDEMDAFKDDLKNVSSELKNKDNIKARLNDLAQELERITVERDEVARKLEILKNKFNKLDKNNLSVQDCEAILNEADVLDHTVGLEYKNTEVVQEKLRQLIKEFKDANKAEMERQKLISQAKDGIKQNREQLKNLKQQLQDILDKANDFEILYKAELNSEDYAHKKDEVEKDLQDIKTIKDDTVKYMKQVDQMMNSLSDFTDSQIEHIQDLEELKAIIEKNDKVASDIRNLAKIIEGIGRDLEMRRVQTQDADIRKNCAKHLADIDKMAGVLEKQVEMLDKFEEHVLSSVQEEQEANKGKDLPPQLAALQNTLDQIKKQLGDFKSKYNAVKADMNSIAKEIKDKDLEHTEPLPNMAAIIDRMSKITNLIKDLKGEQDDLGNKIQQNAGLLGSMDIDKKLQRLLDLLIKAQKIKDTLDAIQRVIDLTGSYDGYTSGDEDTTFFNNMNTDSKDLKEELLKELKNFQDLEKEVRQIIQELEFLKQKTNGTVEQGTIDKINDTVDRIKGLYRKGSSNKEEIDANATNNKDKMSGHQLEAKIQRRKNELERIDHLLNNNLDNIQALKERTEQEIESCGNDATYTKYVNDLKAKVEELEKLNVPINTAVKNYKNIAFDNDQLQQDVERVNNEPESKIDKRLDYFDSHLIIKKRLNHVKEQSPVDQFGKKFAALENDINDIIANKPKKQAYKFVKGDEVDQLLAEMLNKTGESLDIKRLGGGFYMCGDKKIFCKVMNGKLVVRVGGGYVSIEEFIRVYAKKQTRGKTGEEIEVMLGTQEDDATPKTGKNKNKQMDGTQGFHDAQVKKGVVGMGAILNQLKK